MADIGVFGGLPPELARPAGKDGKYTEKQARAVGQAFEALFIEKMLSSMRQTIQKSPLIPQGDGEEMYQNMMDQQTANEMAQAGGIGIAAMLSKTLLRDVAAEAEKPEGTKTV